MIRMSSLGYLKEREKWSLKSSFDKLKWNLWAIWSQRTGWSRIQTRSLLLKICPNQHPGLKYSPWLALWTTSPSLTQAFRCVCTTKRTHCQPISVHMGKTTRWSFCRYPAVRYSASSAEVLRHRRSHNADKCQQQGVETVLTQNGQAVAFVSRTLSPTEQRYATIEKECLAIVFACEKFNLARRENISVETEHKPLESILKKSLLSAPSRLQRMLLRL